MDIDVMLMAFLGALAGALLPALYRAVANPLANRADHKRLMNKADFRSAWGRNPVAFFMTHNGFERGKE